MNPTFIHGHAHINGDTLWHVADKSLQRTLCGKPILALARGLINATCPTCIRIHNEQHKKRMKK